MDSFSSLSLDVSPRNRLRRSMSYSEISPRKKLIVTQNVSSSPSGNAILRQYSCHEIGVSSSGSLRYSQKFVSEYHFELPRSHLRSQVTHVDQSFPNVKDELVKLKNVEVKAIEPAYYSNEVEQQRKRSHDPSDSEEDMRHRKCIRTDSRSKMQLVKSTSKRQKILVAEEDRQHPIIVPLMFVIVPFITAVLATYAFHYVKSVNDACEKKLDLNATEFLLMSNIFGQNKSVKAILDTLTKFNSSEQNGVHVLVMTGPTGVGKTYAASLVEESFPWKHNVHHFIMPLDSKTFLKDVPRKFPYCGNHLVIIDDIGVEDFSDVSVVVSYLNELAKENKVMAVLIFKWHKLFSQTLLKNNYQLDNEVQKKFLEIGVDAVMVDFKTLDEDDVVECVKVSLKKHWIPVTEEAINKVLMQVDYSSEGCKRINSKMAVLNELWVREP